MKISPFVAPFIPLFSEYCNAVRNFGDKTFFHKTFYTVSTLLSYCESKCVNQI